MPKSSRPRGEKASCRLPLGRCSLTRSPCGRLGSADIYSILLGFAHSYLSLRNTTHDQRDSWDAPLVLFGTTGRWPFAKPSNGSHALSGFPVRICIAGELLSQQKLKNDQLFARNDFFTWSTVTRMKRCRKNAIYWYFRSTWLLYIAARDYSIANRLKGCCQLLGFLSWWHTMRLASPCSLAASWRKRDNRHFLRQQMGKL